MSKTIFITGSLASVARPYRLLFASRGWRVIATMRSPEKEAELGRTAGVTLFLDVTKPAQIDAAVKQALALGPVDVLLQQRRLRPGGRVRSDDRRAACG